MYLYLGSEICLNTEFTLFFSKEKQQLIITNNNRIFIMQDLKNNNRIFYYDGFTQFANTGDLLINKTLLDIISSKGMIVVNDTKMPVSYKNELLHNVSNVLLFSENLTNLSFSRMMISSLLKNFIFKKTEIYILENPGHHISKLIKPGKSHYKDFFKKYVQSMLGCNILKIGVTLGPYSDSMSIFYSRISKLYHSILIRDFKTLELTNQFNFSNVSYIPDLAWAYNHDKFVRTPTVEIPKDKYIVLSFRDAIEGTARNRDYYDQIQNSIEKILKTNLDYTFVFSFQVMYDREVCKDFVALFEAKYNVVFIDSCLSISDAMHLYSNSEMVISNRLHVLLLAIKSKTLPVAITNVSQHNKLVSMFYDENVNECVIDVESLDLTNQLDALCNQKDMILNKFDLIVKKNMQLIIRGINQIFKV